MKKTQGLAGKEKAQVESKEMKELHEHIDKNLREHARQLHVHRLNRDTTGYWRCWSKAVERGFLHFLDVSNIFDRKAKGRGEPTFITTKPECRDQAKKADSTRGRESTEAAKALKQARRCEQVAFRLGLLSEEKRSQEKRLTYFQLNRDAIKGIKKNIGRLDWENELDQEIGEAGEIAADTLKIPLFRRTAEKYHEACARWNEKEERVKKEAMQKIYRGKAGGQWEICRNLGSRNAAPLTALRRPKQGEKGQPKGTIATAPREVDKIIREAYGRIYKGNTEDPEKTTAEYLKKI